MIFIQCKIVGSNLNKFYNISGDIMEKNTGINFKNTYLGLSKKLYSLIEEKRFRDPELALVNAEMANKLNISIEFLKSKEGIQFLSGHTSKFGPLYSQGYAGHQYGHFTVLGDGRAMMLGEQTTKDSGTFDLQLKGSGLTPYSRRGDGKATLYSVLREYLISEAMNALGVTTTRSLSVIKTNELVQRESLEPGGILCRVASSHIRVGTFEYAKATGGDELVKELADYSIKRHFKNIDNSENKYQEFLGLVIKNQAKLIAKWQSIGFIHGVMNTDNMTISGETIDYGPCAFMNKYKPDTVFSSIDRNGRYAYKNQPFIGSWNLARFAETLLGLFSTDKEESVNAANKELGKYEFYFKDEYYKLMAKKIGIIDPIDDEKKMIDELLLTMEKYNADFTNTFRLLTLDMYQELPFYESKEWQQWFQKWTRALGTRQMDISSRVQLMEQANPNVIPRNLLVEEALVKASKEDDYTLFNTLLEKVIEPYNYRVLHKEKYLNPVKSDTKYVTYCGT